MILPPHPIDRLAKIRLEMKTLRQESNELRAAILRGEVQPVGEHHSVQVLRQVVVRPVHG